MKVVFWTSDKARERILAEAFLSGVKSRGDDIEIRALTPVPEIVPGTDVACMVGVKSRELYRLHWQAGIHTVYFDKGYSRHKSEGPVRGWEYWRVAVDGHHPTRHLMQIKRPHDRLDALEVELKPWRKRGDHVILAGSSQKYNDFYGLGDATDYAKKLVKRIRGNTEREIVYRPKPSWHDAVPIPGTHFSRLPAETMDDVLEGAWALITHGSNACFEAVVAGVPCVIVGDAVAKPISSTDLSDLSRPRIVSDDDRAQWLANLAYWQFTQPEMLSGMTWETVRPFIFA